MTPTPYYPPNAREADERLTPGRLYEVPGTPAPFVALFAVDPSGETAYKVVMKRNKLTPARYALYEQEARDVCLPSAELKIV